MPKRVARWLPLLTIVLLVSGCSRFDHQYEAALAQSFSSDNPEGPWVGHWKSDKNGHTGELRCIVEKSVDDTYIAQFKARFWKVFTYTTTADLSMDSNGQEYVFTGHADLGSLAGGVYDYEGRITDRFFYTEYRNKWDYGTFYMERPKP